MSYDFEEPPPLQPHQFIADPTDPKNKFKMTHKTYDVNNQAPDKLLEILKTKIPIELLTQEDCP
jgi:hypothetical protein